VFSGTDLEEFYENNSTYDYQNYSESASLTPCSLQQTKAFDQSFLPAFYSLLFVLGLLGNVLVLVVLLRNKRGLQSTDMFILHLAVADILLVLTLPFWAAQAVSGWHFGSVMCKIVGSLFKVNFYAGIYLLACISCDRYLSIVYAVQIYKKHRSHLVHWSCLVVWCLCVLLSLPDIVFFQVMHEYRANMTECQHQFPSHTSTSWRLALTFLYQVLGFLLPLCGMLYCYTHIALTLLRSQGFKKHRALRVIIALVLSFFLCWAPYNIAALMNTLSILQIFARDCRLESHIDIALSVTSGLCYFHCCLNPVLYAFIGVKFKNKFIELLNYSGCICPQFLEKYVKSQARSSTWSESADTSQSGI
ncbi:hypothetical protein FKM82_021224, partial [Ascaphus truei]